MAMCAFIDKDNESFLNWAEKAIQAAPNAPIRRALMITYAMEGNDYNLAKKHFMVLEKTSPNFIGGVLNQEDILFAERKSSERLIKGLQSFLTIHKDKIDNGSA